jgi:hypothetical protein
MDTTNNKGIPSRDMPSETPREYFTNFLALAKLKRFIDKCFRVLTYKHSNDAVIHSQKFTEYGGAEHSVSLVGEKITLNNPDGEIFHFHARLLPEYVGTFHDLDKAYGRRGVV